MESDKNEKKKKNEVKQLTNYRSIIEFRIGV